MWVTVPAFAVVFYLLNVVFVYVVFNGFLPECDYVTFRSLLLQIHLSSVTFMHPTVGLKLSAIFLLHFVP